MKISIRFMVYVLRNVIGQRLLLSIVLVFSSGLTPVMASFAAPRTSLSVFLLRSVIRHLMHLLTSHPILSEYPLSFRGGVIIKATSILESFNLKMIAYTLG
jgi:hypothetical protein